MIAAAPSGRQGWTAPRSGAPLRRDARSMGMEATALAPVGTLWSIDERGTGLRTTWRLDHGFINLSVWRDDRCVETFHLAPGEAARLVSFLVQGLADVASVRAAAPVVPLPTPPAPFAVRLRGGLRSTGDRMRGLAADGLRSAARRIERTGA